MVLVVATKTGYIHTKVKLYDHICVHGAMYKMLLVMCLLKA